MENSYRFTRNGGKYTVSMPFPKRGQIYKEEVGDFNKTLDSDAFREKLYKKALKAPKFPYEVRMEFTGKHGNKYRTYILLEGKKDVFNGFNCQTVALIPSYSGTYVYFIYGDWERGGLAKSAGGKDSALNGGKQFSAHFFQRYKERFGMMRKRNGIGEYADEIDQFIFRNVLETDLGGWLEFTPGNQPWTNHKNEVISILPDGVANGCYDAEDREVVRFNTFLPHSSDFTPRQQWINKQLNGYAGNLKSYDKGFTKLLDQYGISPDNTIGVDKGDTAPADLMASIKRNGSLPPQEKTPDFGSGLFKGNNRPYFGNLTNAPSRFW